MASEAKREATARAVAQAPVTPDVSAARAATWPISVHLTPFAPMADRLPVDHPKRWKTFYGKPPEVAVKATLNRVRLAPAAARVATFDGGVELLGDVPPELVKLISAQPSEPVPFAVFWDGLTASELRAVLDRLIDADWTPPSLRAAAASREPQSQGDL